MVALDTVLVRQRVGEWDKVGDTKVNVAGMIRRC